MTDTRHTGLPEFRAQLEAAGWAINTNGLQSEHNACNWYAWRRERIDGPDCECNDKPPGLMVWPYVFSDEWATRHDVPNNGSATLEIVGQIGGHWLKLHAYSLTPADFFDRLPLASRQLVAAWRAAAEA